MDPVAALLGTTPRFRGKDRLAQVWARVRSRPAQVDRRLFNGVRLRLHPSNPYETSLWLGLEPRDELTALSRMLGDGQTFVDCGANIGVWTITAAQAVGEAGTVYAFEPQPTVFAKLAENLRINDVAARVDARQVAVGERRGEVHLHLDPAHDMSRVVDSADAAAIVVHVERLADVLADRRVDGIKLDVEGYELNALRGAGGLLRVQHPWLCVEFNASLSGVRRLGEWDVHQHLSELGYRASLFVEGPDGEQLSDGWMTALGHIDLLYTA